MISLIKAVANLQKSSRFVLNCICQDDDLVDGLSIIFAFLHTKETAWSGCLKSGFWLVSIFGFSECLPCLLAALRGHRKGTGVFPLREVSHLSVLMPE